MLNKSLISLSLIAGIGSVTILAHTRSPQILPLSKIILSHAVAGVPNQDLEAIAKAITVRVHVGEYRGSGILIAGDNNTYTVITNAHVAERADSFSIETSDGVKHPATLVAKDSSDRRTDLAILEFHSSKTYQVAKLGDSTNLTEDSSVIAAGFPHDADNLHITQGTISLLPDQSLEGGYEIGFSNETVQGMSGGVLLNSQGEVIGVLGKGKGAILDSAYTYIDGTTPPVEVIEKMKDAAFSIPIAKVVEVAPQLASLLPNGNSVVVQTPKPEYTGIVGKVDAIAQQITVRIATGDNPSHGSGVIIAKEGNTYYVATAGHVVEKEQQYQIVILDGESYNLNNQTIEASDGYDVAIFSFESNRSYQVASLARVDPNRQQVVFVSGFPKLGNSQPQRIITGGTVWEQYLKDFSTKDSYSLQQVGLGLLYTNISYGGMSGGAVLDREGRLVGIWMI